MINEHYQSLRRILFVFTGGWWDGKRSTAALNYSTNSYFLHCGLNQIEISTDHTELKLLHVIAMSSQRGIYYSTETKFQLV